MKPKEYPLLMECIEDGVAYGYGRAYKYSDEPTKEQMISAIVDAVAFHICEAWDFDDNE